MKINEDFTVSSIYLKEFQKNTGINYKDTKHLIQALLHGSLFSGDRIKLNTFKKRNNLKQDNYEKLEYLGDNVLSLIVADYSYNNEIINVYAIEQKRTIESVLTDFKRVLVSNESLKPLANKLKLDKYILHGVLENITDIYPDVIEALIGSIFLDQDFSEAKKFVYNYFDLEGALGKIADSNPKGTLNEICDQIGCVPIYEVMNEEGPDHNKIFTVRLICNEQVAIGYGPKIKKAEIDAATKFLLKYSNYKSVSHQAREKECLK